MIELDHNALFHRAEEGSLPLLDARDGARRQTQKVLLRDFQMHPWKPIVLHIDFQRVDDTTRCASRCRCTTGARRTRRRSRPTSA
jgi:large subunit ribosomal protein L25